MPRDLPIGNGSLLVNFDQTYQIRDLYWPHVGQENHTLGHTFRLGVWAEGQFRWLDDPGWERDLRFDRETLLTHVRLHHSGLALTLEFTDAVDFHESLLVRRCSMTDESKRARDVRVFFHHDFHILGSEVGDTAYYEPDRRALLHYKGGRWFLANGAVSVGSEAGPAWAASGDTSPGLLVGIHHWACGYKELPGREGTWRDAEDGELSGNPVAQGAVDSVAGFGLKLPAGGSETLHYWLAVGGDFETVARINRLVRERGPERFLSRTAGYWHLWLRTHLPALEGLPDQVRHQYKRSLLVIRTQVDNAGGIVAANDSDIAREVRDTYSYVWPRDGALVSRALTLAGHVDLPRQFFEFCARALTPEGYLLHKYNPDGTLASSWLPWYRDGRKELPIQEDETALVLWALWQHFRAFGEVEFIKPLYRPFICAAADFLASYRDLESGLPNPSWDLWEERYGVHAFTVGAVWAGLTCAANFAEAFGESEQARGYRCAAAEIRRGTDERLWDPENGRFLRMVNRQPNGSWQVDRTVDAALAGLWLFDMYAPDDSRIASTMDAVRQQLWVNTSVGGVARYENDYYHQVSQDLANCPGNPWFVCTLWLAEWQAATSRTTQDLKAVEELLSWACEHALPSGVLAEQVDPDTGAPLSVSPLTWSHAEYITAVHAYVGARHRLEAATRPD
jgi:glucoamylase